MDQQVYKNTHERAEAVKLILEGASVNAIARNRKYTRDQVQMWVDTVKSNGWNGLLKINNISPRKSRSNKKHKEGLRGVSALKTSFHSGPSLENQQVVRRSKRLKTAPVASRPSANAQYSSDDLSVGLTALSVSPRKGKRKTPPVASLPCRGGNAVTAQDSSDDSVADLKEYGTREFKRRKRARRSRRR